MKKTFLFFILSLVASVDVMAQGNLVKCCGTRPQDTAHVARHFRFDSSGVLLSYAQSDTSVFLAVDENGNLVNRTLPATSVGVASVNGQTGIVSLTTTNIPEGTNKYFPSLLSGYLWVGNGSNAPTAVVMSGDATMINTGAVTLKNTGTAGTYGSASEVPVFTTDAQGRITGVTNTAISGGAPSGSAGGDLSGTYPNPSVASGAITLAKMANMATASILGRNTAGSGSPEVLSASTARSLLGLANVATTGAYADLSGLPVIYSTLASLTDVNFTSIADGQLIKWDAGSSKFINFTPSYISGNQTITFTGDATGSGSTSVALTLATVNPSPGVYGGATSVAQVTVDSKGRATAVSSVAIDYTWSNITSIPATTLTGDITSTVTPGSSGAATIAAGAVSLSKMADMATQSILGRNTAGTGSPEVLSASTTKTILSLNNVENTALSTWAGSSNLVTVGSIGTGVWQGTKVAEAYGGTNQNSYTLGDVLYSSATNTLSKLAGNTTTTKKFFTQTGNGSVSAAPGWNTIVSGDIPDLSATYAAISGATFTGAVIIPVLSVNNQTGTSYTTVLSDAGKWVTSNNGSAVTITIPPNSSVAYPINTYISFSNYGAGAVTITPGSGVTINGTDANRKFVQYAEGYIHKTATDTWIIGGKTTP